MNTTTENSGDANANGNANANGSGNGSGSDRCNGFPFTLPSVLESSASISGNGNGNGYGNRNAVNIPLLTEITQLIGLLVSKGEWKLAAYLITQLLADIKFTSYVWMPIFHLFQMGKYSHLYSYGMSFEEFRAVKNTLTEYLKRSLLESSISILLGEKSSSSSSSSSSRYQMDLVAIRSAISGILKEMGLTELSLGVMTSSLHPVSYKTVHRSRRDWSNHQNLYKRRHLTTSNSASEEYKVHFITYASEETEGLRSLRLSAHISGIDLTVLGLNETYEHYGDKLKKYLEYLTLPVSFDHVKGEQIGVKDNDVVLLIDAYDVLLFPPVLNLHEVPHTYTYDIYRYRYR
jgi:hypothetical protein